MRMLRRLTALCLALLMLCPAALADMPFLQYAATWQLDETPIEVKLTADVTSHMPYDEDRLAMLTPITDQLSLRVMTDGPSIGRLAIDAANTNLLTMSYHGQELYLSSMPDVVFTAAMDPMAALLGTATTTELSIFGVTGEAESLLEDGWVLMEKLLPDLIEQKYGTRKKNSTNVKEMGKAAYLMNATFSEKKADELKPLLLSHCPEGWLREIIEGLNFSGKQTFRVYQDADEVPLRFEYNGTCGPEGDKRTVKLVWRARRDDDIRRDEVTLTSPAKSGTNKNTLKFERATQKNKKGTLTTEGEFSYVVTKDKKTTEIGGEFDLKNASTKKADVITGEATFQQKLPGEKKFTILTFEPDLTITGTQDDPSIEGKIDVKGMLGKGVTEQVSIKVHAYRAPEIAWPVTTSVLNLDDLTEEELARVQQDVSASITTAMIRPLILLLGQEEGDWFFREMPEEAVQEILDAAGSTLVIE